MTTFDVDCVVDITTYREYRSFEEKLFSKHFRNDTSEGAPICRYLFNGEKVDFMPKVDTGIGESNRWYLKGMEHRQAYRLDDNRTIFILPVTYYLASKIEALHSRGGEDYRGSKDFEDIVYVLNSCTNLQEDINDYADQEVREFLKHEFSAMLQRKNIQEEIESSLLEPDRLDIVVSQLRDISSTSYE